MIGGDITVAAQMQKNAALGMPVFDEAFSSLGGIFGSFDFSVATLAKAGSMRLQSTQDFFSVHLSRLKSIR